MEKPVRSGQVVLVSRGEDFSMGRSVQTSNNNSWFGDKKDSKSSGNSWFGKNDRAVSVMRQSITTRAVAEL
jgi:hypothetical protein